MPESKMPYPPPRVLLAAVAKVSEDAVKKAEVTHPDDVMTQVLTAVEAIALFCYHLEWTAR